MQPVGVDTKRAKNVVLQRCVLCGHERWNKTQDNDDFEAILPVWWTYVVDTTLYTHEILPKKPNIYVAETLKWRQNLACKALCPTDYCIQTRFVLSNPFLVS